MKERNQQSGFALLIFIVVLLGVLGLVGSDLMQSRAKSNLNQKIQHDMDVLNKAKQALLGYAVDYKKLNDLSEMGRLPCPDYHVSATLEGIQDSACGVRYANKSGYLPWKTLGIEPLRDSSGECLWYVVSGDYKDDIPAYMLNEDSNGLLRIEDENGQLYHGNDPGDRPIAAIIAPGPILGSQDRTPVPAMTQCRGNYIETNYLEGGGIINYSSNHANTADDIWRYLYGSATNNLDNNIYNDRIVWITKKEYWDAVKTQGDLDIADTSNQINLLTNALAQCLVNYANDANNEHRWLPWPAAIDMSEYRSDGLYQDQDDPSNLMGRFPVDISHSNIKEVDETSTLISLFSSMADIVSDSDCLSSSGITDVEKKLWKNWKDHFFYVVSTDFKIDGSTASLNTRCGSIGDCVTVDEMTPGNKVAGIIFYANSVVNSQVRDADPVDADTKNALSNYMDARSLSENNAHQYPNDSAYQGNSGDVNKYYRDISGSGAGTADLAYCIIVNPITPTELTVSYCN